MASQKRVTKHRQPHASKNTIQAKQPMKVSDFTLHILHYILHNSHEIVLKRFQCVQNNQFSDNSKSSVYTSRLELLHTSQVALYVLTHFTPNIPDKKNAPLRTVQLSGISQVIGQFSLYQCKGMSVTAASHVFCKQASKLC